MFIRRMRDDDRDDVLQLGVSEEQLPFVGTLENVLASLTPYKDCHVIEADGQIVGFFIIDRNYPNQYEFADPTHIGFRAYLIDHRQQGKGYGKASMRALKEYLQTEYPTYPAVVLTVNCRNEIARKIYLQAGFVDHGELYHGGKAGPQHILAMSLQG